MKVLLFSNLYPSPDEPTRGTFNRQIFGALANFCDVRVVSPLPWWTRTARPRDMFLAQKDSSTGLEASYPVYWTIPRVGHSLHGKAMYYSLRHYVARIKAEFPFDALLAAWAYPDAYAAARMAQDFGCPLVTNLMGSDINDLATRPRLRDQISWCLNESRQIVTVSSALRDRVIELGIPAEKIRVQHNGVNGNLFTVRDRREVRRKLGPPIDRKLLVYVGNFRTVKGTDILLEAMGILSRMRADTDLVLAGSGPLEPGLRARSQELGISGRVHFCGRKLHDEIPDWISASDVFCLPSRNEGCPNVILEALASGRPVVASHVGGIPELISQDNGILVPAEDAQALANGMEAALNRTWYPDALRNSVRYLSWNNVGAEYYQVLEQAHHSTKLLVDPQMRQLPIFPAVD